MTKLVIDDAAASLEGSRGEIDEVDAQFVRLLHRRAEIVDNVRTAKLRSGMETYDPAREEAVLERVLETGEGRFPKSALRAVFREIMSGCVAIQQKLLVTYLGPSGSFTEVAALAMFGTSADLRDAPTASGVLNAVARGDAAFGVIPFESSSDGLILNAVEGLLSRSLKIRREYVCNIAYALASVASSLSEVRVVYAHPFQVEHCQKWLREHLPHVRIITDQSTTKTFDSASRDPAAAVLVSSVAAKRRGLNIHVERTNDRLDDAMRFIVVAKTGGEDARADKTAIVVAPNDGAPLADLLATFAAHGVALVSLASRPHPNAAFHSFYFFEVRGTPNDPQVAAVIEELGGRFGQVSVLGSYLTHRSVAWSERPAARADRDGPDSERM